MTVRSDGDHDPETGRFAPGNRASKGNPISRRQRELAEAVKAAVSPDDLRAVFKSLVEAAKTGDVQAAGLLLMHAVGKPREVDPVVELTADVPLLTDSDSAAEIVRQVLADVLAGNLPPDVGDRLLSLTSKATDVLLLDDIERRLRQVELRGAS